MLKVILGLCFAFFMFNVNAKQDVLTVDRQITTLNEFSFPNDDNVQPDIGPFKVLSVIPMSSESGERWALLTIENTEAGQRTLNQSHLVALLANGERVFPEKLKQHFKGQESLSLSVKFVNSKFPVIQVYSRQ